MPYILDSLVGPIVGSNYQGLQKSKGAKRVNPTLIIPRSMMQVIVRMEPVRIMMPNELGVDEWKKNLGVQLWLY